MQAQLFLVVVKGGRVTVVEGVVVAGWLVVEFVVLVMLMAVAVVFMVVLVFCEGKGVWWANPSHIIVLIFVKVVRSSSWTHTLGLNLEKSVK